MATAGKGPVSPFRDLAEVLGTKPKVLPIKGRLYEFPARVSDKLGTKLALASAMARKNPDLAKDGGELMAQFFTNAEQASLETEVLGDSQQLMAEAGISGEWQSHVFKTLLAWHTAGEEVALEVWEGNKPGEREATNRAARRAGSASGGKTRSRASTSGTSPRKAAPRKAAARSRGATSSSTGR